MQAIVFNSTFFLHGCVAFSLGVIELFQLSQKLVWAGGIQQVWKIIQLN